MNGAVAFIYSPDDARMKEKNIRMPAINPPLYRSWTNLP
jgi:hypothetical protein